jgi:hypothetical protein
MLSAGDKIKVHGSVFTVLSLHRKGKKVAVTKDSDNDGKVFFKSTKDVALVAA